MNSLHSLDYKDVFQQGEGVREGKALQQERWAEIIFATAACWKSHDNNTKQIDGKA